MGHLGGPRVLKIFFSKTPFLFKVKFSFFIHQRFVSAKFSGAISLTNFVGLHHFLSKGNWLAGCVISTPAKCESFLEGHNSTDLDLTPL